MKVLLILRKPSVEYNSIEKVFAVLLPFLKIEVLFLPYCSHGVLNKVRNFFYLFKFRKQMVHLSGHDHYLFALPFFKKNILTLHDVEGLYSKRGWKRWLFKKIWFEWPIRYSSRITTVSHFSKKEIERLVKPKKNIQVIYNPLTLPLVYEAKTFNEKQCRLLHIGTKANKNLERLLEAVKDLKVQVVIIGQLTTKQQQLIERYAIQTEILYNLSNDEMMEQYRLCDVLSFTSTYEGFGLPIIEAQAIGRVVLSSNVSSMPEVAGEGALLVSPFEVEDIRNGIIRLMQDGELRTQLIAKGLENVKRFEAETIAEEYLELYESLNNEWRMENEE